MKIAIYIYRYQHYISIIIIIIIIIMIAPYVLKRGNIIEEGCYHNFPFCLSILYFKNWFLETVYTTYFYLVVVIVQFYNLSWIVEIILTE